MIPMGYFTHNRAVKGNKRILERLGGATYYFASRGSRYEFLRDAPRYQPQFGGYCAASLARGRLEDINPRLFIIYEGKLYLFSHPEAEAMFLRDPRRTIYEAREHYLGSPPNSAAPISGRVAVDVEIFRRAGFRAHGRLGQVMRRAPPAVFLDKLSGTFFARTFQELFL